MTTIVKDGHQECCCNRRSLFRRTEVRVSGFMFRVARENDPNTRNTELEFSPLHTPLDREGTDAMLDAERRWLS
jgi:hypothetical protein